MINPLNGSQKDFQRKLDVLMKGVLVDFWLAEIGEKVVDLVMPAYDG